MTTYGRWTKRPASDIDAMAEMRRTGASAAEIGTKFGIADMKTVWRYLRLRGFEPHYKKPQRSTKTPFSPEEIAQILAWWDAGEPEGRIAKRLETKGSVVRKELLRQGRTPEVRWPHGAEHGKWKGGRIVNNWGYVFVRIHKSSPWISMAVSVTAGGAYIAEHRMVVAEHLGRPLLATETVHHINGVKDDNRLENLQLRQGNHGVGRVMRCTDCGSVNVAADRL